MGLFCCLLIIIVQKVSIFNVTNGTFAARTIKCGRKDSANRAKKQIYLVFSVVQLIFYLSEQV